jgi:GNAT superfamily N-acetyltransferase
MTGPPTATIEVHPATRDRWADVLTVFGGPDQNHCWCQYWRMTSSDYSHAGFEQRETMLREATDADLPPGMIAYLDGEPAGWLGFGPRPGMGRLVRSRTIPKIDDTPVWSIFCFLIRVGYRRRGVGRALLDGLIGYARERGAPGLEAYPVDTGGKRIQGTAAYVGTAGVFERAGFRRVVETDARSDRLPRWLMRLEM